jgi:carboxylesterase type B
MDQDVVLVGMNYRLGVLGNFNTNDSLARGNQGLRDQIKALEWVQENIKKFGGDKRKVTLFGNSYGSMAINTHLLSPMTKGLFHQVICESGEAIFPGHLQRHPAEIAVKLGNQLNCTSTNSSADLLQCLRSLPFEKVVLESFNVKPVGNNGFTLPGANIFTTSVDPKLEDVDEDDVYLPEQPLKLLMGGKLKRMPAIIGVNSGEGLFQSMLITQFENLTKVANEKWESILPVALTMDSPIAVNFSRAAREFYFGSNNISFQTRDNLTDLFSDRLGNHPAHTHAFYQKEANRRSQNVFLYYMTKEIGVNGSYFKPFGSIDWEERAELGPAHADEIQFLFPYEPFPLIPAGSKNANYSAMMVRLWADFARDGKPGLADNQAEWVPIKEKPYHWFQLDNEPKMINILEERMKFWDSFELSDLYV